AAAHERHLGPAVLAEHRDLALGTAIDPLRAAVVARQVDRVRRAGQELDAVGLDQQVDHERAARLALAVQAVAAVRDERLIRQPVADRATRAAAFPHGSNAICTGYPARSTAMLDGGVIASAVPCDGRARSRP